jgi:integrase
MPRHSLTASWVASVKPPVTGQVDYFDTKYPHVGLRVSYGGRKAWVVLYRAGGRVRRYTLGMYPTLSLAEAQQQAHAVRHAVALGGDPAQHKHDTRHSPTVAQLVADYLDSYAKVHKKSWRADQQCFTRDILPRWGHRTAAELTRRDILTLLDTLVARGAPIQANRTLGLLRKLFNWAISRDLLTHNPCLQVPPPGKEHQRARILTDAELRRLWTICAVDPLGPLFQLQLLTSSRIGEVRQMRWEDVDREAGWWTIPAHLTKNGLAHRVPLTAWAVDLLHGLQLADPGAGWVFASGKRRQRPWSYPYVYARFRALCDQAALSDLTPHDLRRTAASGMASLGIPRLVIGKVLNHAEPGVTRVYDRHSYDGEKRHALEAWARHVRHVVTGEPAGTVVALRG